MFLYFSLSKVNLLEIAPLYFLGSTLIFIGIDLLYEWVRFMSLKSLHHMFGCQLSSVIDPSFFTPLTKTLHNTKIAC